jgi:hypothetical protein
MTGDMKIRKHKILDKHTILGIFLLMYGGLFSNAICNRSASWFRSNQADRISSGILRCPFLPQWVV